MNVPITPVIELLGNYTNIYVPTLNTYLPTYNVKIKQ